LFLNYAFCFSGYVKKKEDYELELEGIGSIRDMRVKESETEGKKSGLEKKIQYAEIEKVTSCFSPFFHNKIIIVLACKLRQPLKVFCDTIKHTKLVSFIVWIHLSFSMCLLYMCFTIR